MSCAVGIAAATRCTGITKEVTIFPGRALNILGAFSRAIRQAYRWVVVVGAGISWWAVAAVTRLWVRAVGLFTNESVGCAIELVVAWRRWLAHTVGAVRSIGAIAGSAAAVCRPTSTVDAFTVTILAASHPVAVGVVGASA